HADGEKGQRPQRIRACAGDGVDDLLQDPGNEKIDRGNEKRRRHGQGEGDPVSAVDLREIFLLLAFSFLLHDKFPPRGCEAPPNRIRAPVFPPPPRRCFPCCRGRRLSPCTLQSGCSRPGRRARRQIPAPSPWRGAAQPRPPPAAPGLGGRRPSPPGTWPRSSAGSWVRRAF